MQSSIHQSLCKNSTIPQSYEWKLTHCNIKSLAIYCHSPSKLEYVLQYDCGRIILSYAFKMRQDYLSTSYLDQKYLPSERSETREIFLIQVTSAEIILSHFEGIWWYFSHTFHYLTDEISWKIWEILSKWNMDVRPSHLRASYVLTT